MVLLFNATTVWLGSLASVTLATTIHGSLAYPPLNKWKRASELTEYTQNDTTVEYRCEEAVQFIEKLHHNFPILLRSFGARTYSPSTTLLLVPEYAFS
jgi:hypothetical protein